MKKTKTECVVGNMPECPKCKSWNALLDSRDYRTGKIYFTCRDCHIEICADNIEIIPKTLDQAGRGNNSTYTKHLAISGNDWHLEAFCFTSEYKR